MALGGQFTACKAIRGIMAITHRERWPEIEWTVVTAKDVRRAQWPADDS